MNNIVSILNKAALVARRRVDDRSFIVGCIGIRGDGAMVSAYNGAPKFPTPTAHAEGRLCRKLDRNAYVFVSRVTKNGLWAMSKPCPDCERALRRAYVKRAYYTIGPNEYGCLTL